MINNIIPNYIAETPNSVSIDPNGLNSLKQAAKENSPEAIKGVARQFEAVMMNMMLKSMREATPQDSPFDNEQSRTFTAMLDQQLSSSLTAKGLGLADVLARQLSKSSYTIDNTLKQAVSDISSLEKKSATDEMSPNGFLSSVSSAMRKAYPLNSNNIAGFSPKPLTEGLSAADFQQRMTQHAEAASRETGIPAHLMLGQAALESGWGKRELKGADGTPSYNLFGIKATGNWSGKVVEATTTEYINGVKQKRIEKFRAYDSYADSFKDFANLMKSNPRYQNVIANMDNVKDYAHAMQRAGYATDPQYASKLASVIQKVSAS